jgi:hypothetical protein
MLGEAASLAGGVLLTAINDAGLRSGSAEEMRSVHPVDRAEAISFLTATSGEWRRSREFWCLLSDRCPEQLRRWAAGKLGLPIEIPAPSPKASEPLRLFYPVPKPPKKPRLPRSDRALLIAELLKRPEGVSPEEIMERFGWARSTAFGALTSDLRKFGFTGKRGSDGRYRFVEIA